MPGVTVTPDQLRPGDFGPVPHPRHHVDDEGASDPYGADRRHLPVRSDNVNPTTSRTSAVRSTEGRRGVDLRIARQRQIPPHHLVGVHKPIGLTSPTIVARRKLSVQKLIHGSTTRQRSANCTTSRPAFQAQTSREASRSYVKGFHICTRIRTVT